MYNTKLIEIFLSLSKDELHYLKKWVHSPIALQHHDTIKLFDFLFSRRTLTPTTIKAERAYYYIFKTNKINRIKLNYVLSYAIESLNEFIQYYYWKQHRAEHKIELIKAYNHKNLNELTAQLIKSTENSLAKSKIRDSTYLLDNFYIELEKFTLQSKYVRYKDFNIQDVSDKIHAFACAEILKFACTALSFQTVTGKEFQFPFLSLILSNDIFKQYRKHPAVNIYYLIYRVFTSNEDKYFNDLYAVIYSYETYFTEKELKDIFILCINYCIKQSNASKQIYSRYAFELYLHALKKGYLLENGELSRFTFKNVVTIGAKNLKEYEIVKDVIKRYQKYIHADYRESTVLFNNAVLYYELGQYYKAMPMLQKVEFNDVLWNLNAKNMLMKIYFELEEWNQLNLFLKSFKAYLYRQKNIGYHKQRYSKMIAYTEKIYDCKFTHSIKKEELLSCINEETDLGEKEWYLKMISK